MTHLPSEYRDGYLRARAIDGDLADRYARHTWIGDPEADAVVALLHDCTPERRQEWVRGGIEQGPAALRGAPARVRDFFAAMEDVPDWWDGEAALAGCRGFHRHSETFLGAFVGAVLVEGFATLISKSFSVTGRIVDQGVRRLKQNNRHVVEIFMPGGLVRQGDGWKLSVRIRLVHAAVRRLLRESDEWEEDAWGTPVSAAHVAFAGAVFSGLLLRRAEQLGVRLPPDEEAAFMMIWRYSAHLMGVVPDLLFEDREGALRLHAVGVAFEPPPGLEACQLANGLINAAPIVAGVQASGARRRLVRRIYRISRALIGDPLADALGYPPARTVGVLAWLRWRNEVDRMFQRVVPGAARLRRAGQFRRMLDLSHYGDRGIPYRLPERLYAEEDRPL